MKTPSPPGGIIRELCLKPLGLEVREPKAPTRLERQCHLSAAEALRYRERSVAERFNGRLKEEFGARNVMVRGAKKVRLHLMFGVMALFAEQGLKLIS